METDKIVGWTTVIVLDSIGSTKKDVVSKALLSTTELVDAT